LVKTPARDEHPMTQDGLEHGGARFVGGFDGHFFLTLLRSAFHDSHTRPKGDSDLSAEFFEHG
jgi:hypothetical protein